MPGCGPALSREFTPIAIVPATATHQGVAPKRGNAPAIISVITSSSSTTPNPRTWTGLTGPGPTRPPMPGWNDSTMVERAKAATIEETSARTSA